MNIGRVCEMRARPGKRADQFDSRRPPRRQARRVPAPAERLDEQGRRHHLRQSDGHRGALVREERALGGDDVEVGVHAELVPLLGAREGRLRRFDGGVLLPPLLRQYPHRSELVLHLLECGEHRLPVCRDGAVVRGHRLLDRRPAPPSVEQRPR
jgi:hypothetical protein